MSSYWPCKKNDPNGYVFYVGLVSQADTKLLQANPTLATGDVKIAKDDGEPVNLASIPVVDADFTKRVKVVLSQAETNADNITVIFSDAAGTEWCDQIINIQTSAQTLDGVVAIIDALENPTLAQINAEILDVLGVDTISELSQGIPAATPTIKTALMLLYMIARNKLTTTNTELGIHNDVGTKIVKKSLGDDGVTYEESEMESGA